MADGVQRFFVVCPPRFVKEAAACFPEGTDVTFSEQHAQLLNFLDNDENTLVLCRAALPFAQAGPGFAYAAPGHELRSVWQEKMTNSISGASLVLRLAANLRAGNHRRAGTGTGGAGKAAVISI